MELLLTFKTENVFSLTQELTCEEMNDYLKIWTREINDPFARIANGLTGGINFIDLANFNSCSFVATSDMGKCEADTFEILGRMDHSDMRGCNLMVS